MVGVGLLTAVVEEAGLLIVMEQQLVTNRE